MMIECLMPTYGGSGGEVRFNMPKNGINTDG